MAAMVEKAALRPALYAVMAEKFGTAQMSTGASSWRCNNKYAGDKKYATPHVTQDVLEEASVNVMQKVMVRKISSSPSVGKCWMRCLIPANLIGSSRG